MKEGNAEGEFERRGRPSEASINPPDFFSFGTTDIWGRIAFVVGHPVHRGLFSSPSALHSVDASSTFLSQDNQKYLQRFPNVLARGSAPSPILQSHGVL